MRVPAQHPKCPFIARETAFEGCELDMGVHIKQPDIIKEPPQN